jgi:PadR family transcriptional regulator, regulatory protein AphA
MKLSPTAYVILGLLSWGPKSGYDIKAVVDESTRFFWAASYGQIYPELKRLEEAGLIAGEKQPQGGRRRTVYTLTPEGSARLQEWLEVEPETYELRDEALLKLFFASASPDTARSTIEAKRDKHLAILAQFRALEATGKPEGYALRVLRYGIEMQEWCAAWCERALADLDGGDETTQKENA